MKKMLVTTAIFAVAALVGHQVVVNAQTPAPQTAAAPKVAVVNIGKVFQQYSKAQTFKKEMEETLKPYKDAAKAIQAHVVKLTEEGKAEKDQQRREAYDKAITENRRKLEDMDRDVRKLVGKKQEEQLQVLWRDVNNIVKAYSNTNGIQIVMGYGDPTEAMEIEGIPNIGRKMNALDMGSTVCLYSAPGTDISDGVIATLNHYYGQASTAAPTSNTKGAVLQTGGTQK